MDQELLSVFFQFKPYDLGLLVLVQELRENIGALSMGLSPLLSLSVEKLQAQESLPKLVHDVDPQHSVNLMLLEPKQSVHLGQLA